MSTTIEKKQVNSVSEQETIPKIPNLQNYIENAFNAKTGDFLGSPVFAVSYSAEKTIEWNGVLKEIPEQIAAENSTTYYQNNSSLLLENQADYDEKFSAAIDAKYSGIAYSGSLQSSLMYHGNLFTQSNSFYTMNSYVQTLLSLERIGEPSLTEAFKADLIKLPENIETPASQQTYIKFFDKYGSHYLTRGNMGGTVILEATISEEILRSATEYEVTTAIQAGYKAIVTSGSLDINTAYQKNTFLSQHKENIALSVTVLGGLYNTDEKISDWVKSCYNTPTIIFNQPNIEVKSMKLECVSELCTLAGAKAQIAFNIQTLLPVYLEQDVAKDGLIATPKNINTDTVKQAVHSDGFILSSLKDVNNSSRSTLQAFEATSDNPNIMRACASQHYYPPHDMHIRTSSSTMPVIKGDFYNSVFKTTDNNPACTNQFIGLGDDDQNLLGEYTALDSFNNPVTAPCDGFIVGYVDGSGDNGSRSYLVASQNLDGNYVPVAGASQHWYTSGGDSWIPMNSFCMPIKNGTKYILSFNPTCGSPIKKAFFVPLANTHYFFDKLRSRNSDTVYEAKSDGFLIAFLTFNNNGDRGYINAYSFNDQNLLESNGLMTSTSIHYYTDSDRHIGKNTLMIPVPKGNYYKVGLTNTCGKCSVTTFWIPIGLVPMP